MHSPPCQPALQSAACCLVIVERIEGGALAQQAALQLMQAALGVGQYGLSADLLRFLVPPGEGEALLTPSSAAAAVGADAAGEAAGGMRQQHGQPAVQAAGQAPAAEAAAAREQQGVQPQAAQPTAEQPTAEQPPAGGSWFWGLLGMGGGSGAAHVDSTQAAAAAANQQQAAAEQQQRERDQEEQQWRQQQEAEEAAAAGDAWRLTAQHAWKLLDSGALR